MTRQEAEYFGMRHTSLEEADKLLAAYKRGEQWAVEEMTKLREQRSNLLFD